MRRHMNPNLIFKNRQPLSVDEVRFHAPSVFGEDAHESRTGRYQHISTAMVMTKLMEEGFYPVFASQQRVRNESRVPFTRHVLKFRHPNMTEIAGLGGVTPEVGLMNSHDGSTTYKLFLGFFRVLCANGMYTGDMFSGVVVRHKGEDIQGKVIDGAYKVIQDAPRLAETLSTWRETQMAQDQISDYGNGAIKLIYGDEAPPVQSTQITTAHRDGDIDPNLWNVFNRVQENVINGGLSYIRPTGRRRNGHTRSVTGLNRDVAVNQALWNYTEGFAGDRLLLAA